MPTGKLRPAAPALPARRHRERTAKPLQTILAIDDQRPNLRLLEAWLRPQGYRMLEAGDAAAALELCTRERPDLVLLNLHLAGDDGLALLARIKAFAPDVPVVIVTAQADRTTKLRGLERGASDCMAEPLDRAELLLRVRNLLRLRSLAHALSAKAARDDYQRALREELEERQAAIARELHDSVGSTLAAASLMLGNLGPQMEDGPARLLAGKAHEQVLGAAEQVRSIARGIMPGTLQPQELDDLLAHLADDISHAHAVHCTFRRRGDLGAVAPSACAHVYRIALEAVANVLRHSGATHVQIHLLAGAGAGRLSVTENGSGCDPAQAMALASRGLGIRSMQARADEIGGSFEIRALPTGGCQVRVTWPVLATAAPAVESAAPVSS